MPGRHNQLSNIKPFANVVAITNKNEYIYKSNKVRIFRGILQNRHASSNKTLQISKLAVINKKSTIIP